jgi:hypothetical protein
LTDNNNNIDVLVKSKNSSLQEKSLLVEKDDDVLGVHSIRQHILSEIKEQDGEYQRKSNDRGSSLLRNNGQRA